MANQLINISRREAFSKGLSATLSSAHANWPQWMPRIAMAGPKKAPKGDTLVVIFLRGGADGLSIIVPHGEPNYYKARPTIAMARPDDKKADKNLKALELDGFFGASPFMAPLMPFFKNHQMLAVHATGSTNPTRSHFEAMDFMERGEPDGHALGTGWIGRHLASLDTGSTAFLRGIGWGDQVQQALRGTVNATALRSIVDYHLGGDANTANQMLNALNSLYNLDQGALQQSAAETKQVVDLLKKVNVASYKPAGGVKYDPNSDLDMALMQTAALIKADVGLEVSAIDVGGWDMHISLMPSMAGTLTKLAKGLANFGNDMAASMQMQKLTVVVMSEFGRRVGENADRGLDHGHGNAMLIMGGNVAPRAVITKWPGLKDPKLDSGDLAITIDYRDVLSEILTKRLNNDQIDTIFPGYKPTMHGIVK